MTYFIIFLIVIVSFHFIYDGIILPSIRLHLRNQLFIVRDELRDLRISGKVIKEDQGSFALVEISINTSLKNLHSFNFVNLNKALKAKDKEIEEKSAENFECITNSKNKELHSIFIRVSEITFYAFVANMGGWLIYFLPIAVCINYFKKMKKVAKEILLLPSSVRGSNFGYRW